MTTKRQNGICYLIGGGPGDPGLITRRGLACLRRAEVVYYDRLANDLLLEEAPPRCELIFVGKEARKPGLGQEEICRQLVSATRAGRIVVRLKGGDPFVFGRGGEEAMALAAAGLRFEIVPGISAAIGAAACAGIPVTHRGLANGVTFVTGHQREEADEKEKIDWRKLAALGHTLCVYMGVETLPHICRALMAGGLAPETPAALVENGTMPAQRCLEGTLAGLPEMAATASVCPPSMLLVGRTVGLRQACAWFEKRPLSGQLVWIAAPDSRGGEWEAAIAELGGEVQVIQAARIAALDNDEALAGRLRQVSEGDAFDWVAFTSRNGVEQVWACLRRQGLDARAFNRVRLAAVGPATAEALAAYGLVADLVPEQASADGLAQAFARTGQEQGAGCCRILLPRSSRAGGELVEKLRALGFGVVEVSAYDTHLPTAADTALQGQWHRRSPDAIIFSSPSAVAGLQVLLGTAFAESADKAGFPRLVALGETTAQAMARFGLPSHGICSRPDATAIIESLRA